MSIRDHDWRDDALAHDGAGWKHAERYTCTRCGLQKRINYGSDKDRNATRVGASWMYFRGVKRIKTDGVPRCES